MMGDDWEKEFVEVLQFGVFEVVIGVLVLVVVQCCFDGFQ